MSSRITLILLTAFWLTMTYLLWRSEYVVHQEVGSRVPLELVWRKILTSPDPSGLEITHQGVKVGYCKLASSIGQELAMGKFLNEGMPPDANGNSAKESNYRLDLEGNLSTSEFPGRLRLNFEIVMNTNEDWREVDLQFKLKRMVWQVHSLASEKAVSLVTLGGPAGRTERVFKFADLQDPQMLLQDFDVPAPLGLLGMMSAMPRTNGKDLPGLGLEWKVRDGWIKIGHNSVRAYRLEASLFERYRMLIMVSGVGEILRVELPDGWKLENDQLTGL